MAADVKQRFTIAPVGALAALLVALYIVLSVCVGDAYAADRGSDLVEEAASAQIAEGTTPAMAPEAPSDGVECSNGASATEVSSDEQADSGSGAANDPNGPSVTDESPTTAPTDASAGVGASDETEAASDQQAIEEPEVALEEQSTIAAGEGASGQSGTDEKSTNADQAESEEEPAINGAASARVEAAPVVQPDAGASDAPEAEAQISAVSAAQDVARATKAAPAARTAAKARLATMSGAKDTGDFVVTTDDEDNYDFADGVLTVKGGKVTVRNKDASTPTANRIQIGGNSELTLAGVNIEAANEAAIKVLAGVKAVLHLAEGSENTVVGGAGHAGVEVGFQDGKLATLTIDGEGALDATGGSGSAGIGGSYANVNEAGAGVASYAGNIVINGGVINAIGNGGAGIGAGHNNGNNADGTHTGKSTSYPMGYAEVGAITVNGGTITAVGKDGAAGIGGGNHTDSGLVAINGGTISAVGNGGGAGIGNGIGSQKRESDGTKGPGSYYAEVVINGGDVTATSVWLGAGIGGGYGCDANVIIKGGNVTAFGGNGNAGTNYQGGPGVGAGYMGLAVVTIEGGEITAKGGTGAPGIGNGAGALAQAEDAAYDSKKRGSDARISYDKAVTTIHGGTVIAEGGENAAGIGTGNGNEVCHVVITGGTVVARGYSDPNNLKAGGAGIGSGTGLNGAATKYQADTDAYIVISGGNVVAVGGWGAAGIGSGAENKQALSITIDAANANIEAYADGTKFAIDTRAVGADGKTTTADNTHLTGNLLQGTFVHAGEIGDKQQNPEGLTSIVVTNELTGETKTLTGMLAGYRSFASSVANAGRFTVFTDDENIGDGQGRYFAKCATDVWSDDGLAEHEAYYIVETGSLKDNYYLFPVKSVVVTKQVQAREGLDAGSINQTFFFALWVTDPIHANGGYYLTREDGSIWVESVRVVNGVAQNTAKFIGLDDMTFGVWEVADEQGNDLPNVAYSPYSYGAYRLVEIATAHGDTADNDATLDERTWTDAVTVINTFEAVEDEADDPADDPADPQSDDRADPTVPDADEPASNDPQPETPAVTPQDEQSQPVAADDDPTADSDPTSDGDDAADPTQEATEDAAPLAPVAPAAVPAVAAAPAGLALGLAGAPAAPAAAPAAPAPAAGAFGQAIPDDATPLDDGTPIEDDANPLAGAFDLDPDCWVHWWILLGIVLTLAYTAVVVARRRHKTNTLDRMDRDVLNGNTTNGNTDVDPAVSPHPVPAL